MYMYTHTEMRMIIKIFSHIKTVKDLWRKWERYMSSRRRTNINFLTVKEELSHGLFKWMIVCIKSPWY